MTNKNCICVRGTIRCFDIHCSIMTLIQLINIFITLQRYYLLLFSYSYVCVCSKNAYDLPSQQIASARYDVNYSHVAIHGIPITYSFCVTETLSNTISRVRWGFQQSPLVSVFPQCSVISCSFWVRKLQRFVSHNKTLYFRELMFLPLLNRCRIVCNVPISITLPCI